MENKIVGYKVFNPDWTCRGFQFEIGKTYEMEDKPIACRQGFHFCTKAVDCFNYYSFDSSNKVALVEAIGDYAAHEDDSKVATNKIVIVKELNWNEVLELVNTGKNNAGKENSGNRNSGDMNSGDMNSGDMNSGFANKSNYQTGAFNTTEGKIRLFNTEFDMSPSEFYRSKWYYALTDGGFELNEFINSSNMTDDEKLEFKDYETLGGYLKTISYKEAWANNWKNKSEANKELVKQMPNFDAEIFYEITGIDLR